VSDMTALNEIGNADSLVYAVTQNNNGFYGLDDIEKNPIEDNAIPAVIHDTQEIVSGATIRLRLTEEVTLNGHVIPKDEYIYGTCNISGERLMINITSMRHENSIYPVALSAYGMDGLPGIHIPMQSVQMMSMDPTLEMQAATLGLETAKGFFSKKTRLIKVTVKAEHPLLLKDI
jgi:conjugative transposon TraM protein